MGRFLSRKSSGKQPLLKKRGIKRFLNFRAKTGQIKNLGPWPLWQDFQARLNGGVDVDLSFLFWSFPDFSGIFPICPGTPGTFPICPFPIFLGLLMFIALKSTYEEQS